MRIESSLGEEAHCDPTMKMDILLSRGIVTVRREMISFIYDDLEEDVFPTPSLVDREDILISKNFLHLLHKMEIRSGISDGFISEDHSGPLLLAHGRGP